MRTRTCIYIQCVYSRASRHSRAHATQVELSRLPEDVKVGSTLQVGAEGQTATVTAMSEDGLKVCCMSDVMCVMCVM